MPLKPRVEKIIIAYIALKIFYVKIVKFICVVKKVAVQSPKKCRLQKGYVLNPWLPLS